MSTDLRNVKGSVALFTYADTDRVYLWHRRPEILTAARLSEAAVISRRVIPPALENNEVLDTYVVDGKVTYEVRTVVVG